nr:hypothetical protein [Tanacetum cinerariifolium]
DLKAQLQDKSIAISNFKKLIEKLKGKSVDTKIEKSSVIRQLNAFKSPRPSVLGKPTTFSNSFIRNDFSKSTSVAKNNVSNDFSKPVTTQTLPTKKKSCLKNTNVLAPGMFKIHTDHTQARTSKLPQDSKKTNKSVSFSTGIIPTTSVSRPQLKSNPKGDRVLCSNSQGKKLEVEEHRRNVKLSKNKMHVTACTDNLNAKTVNVKSVFALCAKCVMIDKHDLYVPKSVAKPLRKPVASESIKKPRNNDKGIAISELKKLIEKLKGKYVETKFEKSSVIRQPNAFKSQRPSILGKPTTFSNSFIRKDFSKSTSVTQTHVSNDFSKPFTAQILPANKKNTNVLNPGMYKIHTDHTQTRTSKLPPDSRITNKRVSFSTGVILTTSVSRPQLKSNP